MNTTTTISTAISNSEFHNGIMGFIIDNILSLIHYLGTFNMGWLSDNLSNFTFYSFVISLFCVGTILSIILGSDDDE